MARSKVVMQSARFDPRLKMYWYLQVLWLHFVLIFTGLGLLTFPLWMAFGLIVAARRYDALEATLYERSIHLRSGVMFKVEKTIPLEKIQDLSLRSGPLLNAFGLSSVQVETAGGGGQHADMTLPGLMNAEEFRNAVLDQQEVQAQRLETTAAPADDSALAVLREIRDSLARIEARLGEG